MTALQLNKERGSALMLSLLLIFVMSLIGVSTMRSATLEKRMAANSVQTAYAFQAAETATEERVNDQTVFSNAYTLNGTSIIKNTTQTTDPKKPITSNSVRYLGEGGATGNSIGLGSGFTALRFEVIGEAELPAVNARAQVVQGGYLIAPSLQ